jgi:hypothetical protein
VRAFDEFWRAVLGELNSTREIRNWTPFNGYAIGGKFLAVSYRALPPEVRAKVTGGYSYQEPDNWIVCTQLQADGITFVSKKEFSDRYGKWRDYRNNGMTRRMFNGRTAASPYLIAIFKEFDRLTE